MPKMDGITLTRQIMKRNPEFPIMIMTGFAKDSYMGRPVFFRWLMIWWECTFRTRRII
jgi:hypothetical protein